MAKDQKKDATQLCLWGRSDERALFVFFEAMILKIHRGLGRNAGKYPGSAYKHGVRISRVEKFKLKD